MYSVLFRVPSQWQALWGHEYHHKNLTGEPNHIVIQATPSENILESPIQIKHNTPPHPLPTAQLIQALPSCSFAFISGSLINEFSNFGQLIPQKYAFLLLLK